MSILDKLDQSDFFNGKMDQWIEKRNYMLEFFKGRGLSVLIVDPRNEMPLDVIETAFPDLFLKTFDLAHCNDGDFNRIGRHLNQYIDKGECAYVTLSCHSVRLSRSTR